MYQNWKKNILKSNKKIANKYVKKEYLIYDFSVINEKTLEKIKSNKNMNWFYDPIHFTKIFGEEMMNFIFDPHKKDNNDIGYILNSSSFDKYLERNNRNFIKFENVFNSYFDLFEITSKNKKNCINL